ncbi:MAG: methionyl-tRNA formyltransferase [Megasphaera sp.]|nr:methionyl-tRNA formyltransferase [Megasphaera sp.]MCI1823011.1 methionyl-tRNA formyltransferase [Megasphaera sp.]
MKHMRIVFMGTPDFAVPSLQAIHHQGYDIAAVVTQPDKERGRGKRISSSPVKECAELLKIPVLQPRTMRDETILAQLQKLRPDVIIVIAYGKILPKEVLEIPPFGCLNVHGSLLPKYRGAAPIQRAIYEGAHTSGITIMMLDEGMDTGKMLKKCAIPLDVKETTGTLFKKLSKIGSQALIEVLNDLKHYEAHAEAQCHTEATYADKITKEMAEINWADEAAHIECLIRALDPQPGAYCMYQGKRLKIWKADVVSGRDALPGTILEVTKQYFTVQTGSNAIQIYEIQPESRKRVTSAQFLQGCALIPGQVLQR